VKALSAIKDGAASCAATGIAAMKTADVMTATLNDDDMTCSPFFLNPKAPFAFPLSYAVKIAYSQQNSLLANF
jgi:hypothetical protein